MIKFQREKHRKLVDELKQRRANGEKGLIISNGSLVSRRQAEQSTSSDIAGAGSSTGEDQMSS